MSQRQLPPSTRNVRLPACCLEPVPLTKPPPSVPLGFRGRVCIFVAVLTDECVWVPAAKPSSMVLEKQGDGAGIFRKFSENYASGKELGRGQFGVTYLCTRKGDPTNTKMAVKVITKDSPSGAT